MNKIVSMALVLFILAGCSKEDSDGREPPVVGSVDLGLSVDWAECNLGAENAWDYGNYYAWGETTPKSGYTWNSYVFWINGSLSDVKLRKYVTANAYGNIDGLVQLDSDDDVARKSLGKGWRMPTDVELAELRDKKIQKDSMRFRRNMERIGMYAAMEISKTLAYQDTEIQTPLGIAQCKTLSDKIVISSILRAGLTLHNGVLEVFDKAENSFIAAYRKYGNDNKFIIQMEYMSRPPMEGKVLILTDCMIATGSSLMLAYNKLIDEGEPVHTHIVASICSEAALKYLSKQLPHKRVTLWIGAVDEELTNKAYIIPGLGDAGDLAYGEKI